MNKEDILKEIENDFIDVSYYPARSDCCDMNNQSFEDVILDNIVCYRLTFKNCIFKNVQFLNNQIELIEFRDCQFVNSSFKGELEDTLLIMKNNSFYECEVSDFKFEGFDEQSEIIDNTFEACSFSRINIESDLTISGGEIIKSIGNELDCKMNMIFEVKIANSKFSNVNIEAAILDNSFNEVEIADIDLKERCVIKNNKYENCYIDSKLVEG